ncbi:MAG: hypothetical protein A2603_14210 [Bdellovibrionales bacterium RIFOXYD1_FULL_55_31]|nr:MAG: hypothetical protein A2603_14210 [Bdellovibrionales bacterium RIFOXYD1_FULL_55_31]
MQFGHRISATIWVAGISAALMISAPGCSKKPAPSGVPSSTDQTQPETAVPAVSASGTPAAIRDSVPGAPVANVGKENVAKTVPAPTVPGSSVAAVTPGLPQTGDVAKKALQDVAKAPAPVEPAKPAPPPEECFNIVYQHKATAGHSSDEACSQHQNLIKLNHAISKINARSLCVRVNGTPVRYQPVKNRPDEIVIGPLAGPQSKIVARYCMSKIRCTEECNIPRDEFMDAIGGSTEDGNQGQLGKWEAENDSNSAKMHAELKKELADFEEKGSVFRDWISDVQGVACGLKPARAQVKR